MAAQEFTSLSRVLSVCLSPVGDRREFFLPPLLPIDANLEGKLAKPFGGNDGNNLDLPVLHIHRFQGLLPA